MVNIRDRLFLISGNNFASRLEAIKNIKKRIFKKDSPAINTHTFYSKVIELKDLQEKVFTRTFDGGKLLIFKDFSNLPSIARNFIFDNMKKILNSAYVVFETDQSYYSLQKNKKINSDKLFSFVLKKSTSIRASSIHNTVSMDEFMGSLRKNDLLSSLYIAERLFKKGSKDKLGPQMMGMLVSNFSYLNNFKVKKKCLEYLWEADRSLKERGVDTQVVISTLLVKLLQFSKQ